jgi:hypothetical protein
MAREATKQATAKVVAEVREFVKDVNFKGLVREIVLQEMKKQFGKGGALNETFKGFIRQEAQRMANEYVEKNIQVRYTGGDW